jgi:hypothetical protein
MSNRKRAQVDSDSEIDVGKQREHLYGSAFSRIDEAIDEGYYLEAITLVESLISDRLESRLGELRGDATGFKPLGNLVRKMKSEETDSELKNIVSNKVDNWRDRRNTALHEMVKIEKGEKVDWDERMKNNKSVAVDGKEIVREVDNRIRAIRR